MTAIATLPCNSRMAAALLDVLGTSGDIGGRARALRLAGADAGSVRLPSAWISEGSLRAMFEAVAEEERLLERVGQALVGPDSLGFPLWYAGFATPEKALRRCDQIFAREGREGSYRALSIGAGRATIAFEPAEGQAPWPPYCKVRAGMLRALPLLFGLMPASVEETQCASQGASHCEFRASWDAASRQGLVAGGLLGAGVAGAAALGVFGAASLSLLAGASALGALLGSAIGRSRDLARQLEAVAGARRGQLALLDQADRMLAERMDALAKLDTAASLQSGGSGLRRSPTRDADPEQAHWWADTVSALRAALRKLSGAVDALDPPPERASSFDELRAATDAIAEIEVRIAERARGFEGPFEPADLAAIARQAARTLRLEAESRGEPQTPTIEVALAHGGGRAAFECRPFQIEEALVQLLRNAVAVSLPSGTVRLELERDDDRYEISVGDSGPGFPPEVLEALFDPFESGPAAARRLGLQIVSRIARAHEGELRVESEPGSTRVSLLLPRK